MYFSSNFQSESFCYSDGGFSEDSSLSLSVLEVLPFLKKVPNKSVGPDGLPPWVFRDFAHFLCPAVTNLFNRSLQKSCVPLCFKQANVVPIPKSSNPVALAD